MDLIRDVRLEIDELVFTGLGAVDAAGVASVFEHELSRLVRAKGLPAAALRPERIAEVIGALPPLPATGSARRMGTALAGALFSGLSGDAASQKPRSLQTPQTSLKPQTPVSTSAMRSAA